MLFSLADIVLVTLTFLALSDVTFVAARRWLRDVEGLSDRHLFFLTRGLGPAVVAVGMYVLLVIFPRRPPAFYIALLILVFALLIVYGRRQLPLVAGIYLALGADLRRLDWRRGAALWILIALLAGFILAVGVGIPMTAHDGVAAAMEARIMLRERSMDLYLAVNTPDPQTGFYIPDFRPPFLHGLYLWFGMLTGEKGLEVLARTVTPLYGWHCLILLAYTVIRRRKSLIATAWTVFLLAVTPIFVLMSYSNGVDTPRLYLAFLALLWFVELTERAAKLRRAANFRLAVGAGAVSGLALFSHLINAPVVAAGGLAYLALSRERWRKRLATGLAVALIALVAGAQFHYLHPGVLKQLGRNFTWTFIGEWAAITSIVPTPKLPSSSPPPASEPPPPPASEPPPPSTPTLRTHSATIQNRGQGGDPLSQLLFGRLQMFTGIEHFGWLFYLFSIAVVVWLLRSPKTVLDKVLLAAAVMGGVAALSGMRKLSWSNPRYIGSLVLYGAYFAGPWLAGVSDRLRSRVPRLGGRWVLGGAAIVVLLAPLCVSTSILGAKIGFSNQGTFYSDFRSLRWVDHALREPVAASRHFWERYMGIRKTLRYLWADRDTQLENAHDFLAAVVFIKHHTPPDSRALVFRDARYFYYAERPGYVWNHPEISYDFRRSKSAEELHRFLMSKNVTHVVIDRYSERFDWYRKSRMGDLLTESLLAERVYEHGIARVYRLIP